MIDWTILTVRLHPERDAELIAWVSSLPTGDARSASIRGVLLRGVHADSEISQPQGVGHKDVVQDYELYTQQHPVQTRRIPAPIRKTRVVDNDEELTYSDDIE